MAQNYYNVKRGGVIMQARSVCARVIEHARKLDTRALMGMMNAGICLYERDGIRDAVMVLAQENNRQAVTLLIQQFNFSVIDAIQAAAAAGHTGLVRYLMTLVHSAALSDMARFRAMRGYVEAGPAYNPYMVEMYKESDHSSARYYLESLMGCEKNASPAAQGEANEILEDLIQIDNDLFYGAIDGVMMIAGMRGDIQRIHALNQLFWGGNALTQNDMYFDPAFSRPNQCLGVMTGLVLGRHRDLLVQYNAHFQSENPALVARLLREQGAGVGMLGEMDLLEECTQSLQEKSDLLKNFKIGVMNGLMFGYRIPALVSMLKSLDSCHAQEDSLSPEIYQAMINEILVFCSKLHKRWGINFIGDLLPDISKEKLDHYFEGCSVAEKFYIGATQYDEATRIILVQSMGRVTPEDVFDVGHPAVVALMQMKRTNDYMKNYALTFHQVSLLKMLGHLLNETIISLMFVFPPHVVEKVVEYLIANSVDEVREVNHVAITDSDIHPLTHAIVDVAKAQLSRCGSRLFSGVNPRCPAFDPNMAETKRLWDAGLKRRV
jgi:hypothetical protein